MEYPIPSSREHYKLLMVLIKALELDSFQMDRHWCIVECSAVTGKGLQEGIDWIVTELAGGILD
jgi:translation initiation factor IF-2